MAEPADYPHEEQGEFVECTCGTEDDLRMAHATDCPYRNWLPAPIPGPKRLSRSYHVDELLFPAALPSEGEK